MRTYLLVALGSAIGGVARHWCTNFVASRVETPLPVATIGINVVGSLLIGLIAAVIEAGRSGSAQDVRDFVMVGVLGGYTTFSAFSLQTLMLIREDKLAHASANVALSVALCLFAVWLGYSLGKLLRASAA